MSSGFVTEKSLQEAQERRKQEWAETYERLGQKPPEEIPEEKYDPRPLYEKLREQKDKKQEDFEERMKFKNQFRGIDDEEAAYLADVSAERQTAELARQQEIDQELAMFRERKMTRSTGEQPEASTSQSPPLAAGSASSNSASTPLPSAGGAKKKKEKKGLKGIIVKKKSGSSEPSSKTDNSTADKEQTGQKRKESGSGVAQDARPEKESGNSQEAKKLKTDTSS